MGDAIKTVIVFIFSVFLILTSRDSCATQVADPAWRGISQPAAVIRQIQDISSRVKQLQATGNLRGLKVIFYGPPSQDKANSAQLLASQLGLPLYRVDLASVTNKYIGETEKNLSKLFSAAESKNWVLFFDAADALFGKRTDVSDSHEKYANQEISYLLQRIEAFSGIIIITSNNPATKSKIRHDHAIEFTAATKPAWPPTTKR